MVHNPNDVFPSPLFLSVKILIIIIGNGRKKAINISSAATKWGSGGVKEVAATALKGAGWESRASQPLSLQPTSVSYGG